MQSLEGIHRQNREAEAKLKPRLTKALALDLLNEAYQHCGFESPTLMFDSATKKVIIKDAITGKIAVPDLIST
jgi:hypothetical protein